MNDSPPRLDDGPLAEAKPVGGQGDRRLGCLLYAVFGWIFYAFFSTIDIGYGILAYLAVPVIFVLIPKTRRLGVGMVLGALIIFTILATFWSMVKSLCSHFVSG